MKQICFLFISTLITIASFAQRKNTSYKTGETFTDCEDCPEMIVIPAGNFTMGSPENEPGHYPEESPQRKINIKQFAAGKFDITKEQWAAFVKATNRVTTNGCSWAAIPGDTAKHGYQTQPQTGTMLVLRKTVHILQFV